MEDRECYCPDCGKRLSAPSMMGLCESGKYRIGRDCCKGLDGCGWSGYEWFELKYVGKTTCSKFNESDIIN